MEIGKHYTSGPFLSESQFTRTPLDSDLDGLMGDREAKGEQEGIWAERQCP